MDFLKKHTNPYFLIIAVVVLSTFVLYLPFITNTLQYLGFQAPNVNMQTVYQNYDGVLYIVPAKAWYNPKAIEALRLEQQLPLEYYAAHLPLYPVFISLFGPLIGYLPSMIVVTILFSILLAMMFYYLVSKLNVSAHPLLLTIVFLFLPRFFIIRNVGAPETLFLFLILASIYFFEKKNYLLAGLLGGLSAATKTPGVLLFVAYALVFFEQYRKEKKISVQWLSILLIPLGLVIVFLLYGMQFGDFYAYFHTSGVVPMPYPFSVFNFNAKWVDTAWLEEIVLYFFLFLYAVFQLRDSKYRSFYYFSLVFFIATIFVQHRDLSRYLLPLWPFAAIAFEKTFTSKKFLLVCILLLPAIYFYAWNFLQFNILPIADWRPFL